MSDKEMHFALIPQHIILMVPSIGGGSIHLISTNTLRTYWEPIVGPTEFSAVLMEDIPQLSMIENNDTEQYLNKIVVHESPIRDGNIGFGYTAQTLRRTPVVYSESPVSSPFQTTETLNGTSGVGQGSHNICPNLPTS
ncbi:hypothetical protein B0H12DRAFT_1236997 [Mycena haematopus]|nr:hypothetical protein B0H12DRAFT_1236997 [Mycena haematopus]